ncbi:uncharacterized protein QC761_124580 [Podospora bellae-mahoneyi]|uniref:Asl1-like glycosyl hydrolase catalytic domain-containing protein n=1 Tax=Podospora bellae-mahoneyi TaxID=2093777 RepID=A0ABR0FW53_9PEZI|nr:hypothetical protein QC761_124580 [Podospora bellae-mahoneyi]
MGRFSPIAILALLLSPVLGQTASPAAVPVKKNPKRGLVSTPNEFFPRDDFIWSDSSSPLSWYWNFAPDVTEAYANFSQSEFEFVPSMWGAYTPNGTDTYFLGNLTEKFSKRKPSHVLTFNLPDQSFEYGGSEMTPEIAARTWVNNILPLREEHGIKVGFPTVSDPRGGWVDPFLKNCSKMNDGHGCEFDFVPLHSFGGFGTLKDNIGKWQSKFPEKPLWVTEYGFHDQNEAETQKFFNESLKYLEEHQAVARYSWFGAFRKTKSNVGEEMAMLDQRGNLTDIGNWYLDRAAALRTPEGVLAAACTLENPCGGSGAAGRASYVGVTGIVIGLFQLGVTFWM